MKKIIALIGLLLSFSTFAVSVEGMVLYILPAGVHPGKNCTVTLKAKDQLHFSGEMKTKGEKISFNFEGPGINIERIDHTMKSVDLVYTQNDVRYSIAIIGKTVTMGEGSKLSVCKLK
jgi:hypothetical protein